MSLRSAQCQGWQSRYARAILDAVGAIVIGAGQAGLAVSRELCSRGIDNVVLEQSRTGQSWRDRWDSFTLVTPNWTLDLPGSPYDGDDPEGHVARDDIVAYLERYRDQWKLPVREGVRVDRLTPGVLNRFRLRTSIGDLDTDVVVVCTGAFQRPYRPATGVWPASLAVMDASEYRNPDHLPDGDVLVIGSGQTGCQFAEELHLAGRGVYLSCGRAPWAPRRLDGIDAVTWAHRVRFFDQPLSALPTPAARLTANPQTTGARGGHDLHYRTLQALGVRMLGRLSGVNGHRAGFVDDLGASVAFGDARWADLCTALRTDLPRLGYPVPELPTPDPFRYRPIEEIDLHGLGAVIFTSGFRPDYSWIDFDITDPLGFPITQDGRSTTVPGLYFCGVHFMRIRRSAFLFGIGDDATVVADQLATRPQPAAV